MQVFLSVLFFLWIYKIHAAPQLINNLQNESQINNNKSENNNSDSTILHSEFRDDGIGNFHWAFETSDGFKAEQTGVPGKNNREGKSLTRSYNNRSIADENDDEVGGGEEISGSYSYKAPDGQIISVVYTAGKNGFRPIGSHIPTLNPPSGSKQLKSEEENYKKFEHEYNENDKSMEGISQEIYKISSNESNAAETGGSVTNSKGFSN